MRDGETEIRPFLSITSLLRYLLFFFFKLIPVSRVSLNNVDRESIVPVINKGWAIVRPIW